MSRCSSSGRLSGFGGDRAESGDRFEEHVAVGLQLLWSDPADVEEEGMVAKAAVLMGCKTMISGISPAIAQTITELGVQLGAIRTTATIESALRESIEPAGARRSGTG